MRHRHRCHVVDHILYTDTGYLFFFFLRIGNRVRLYLFCPFIFFFPRQFNIVHYLLPSPVTVGVQRLEKPTRLRNTFFFCTRRVFGGSTRINIVFHL